MKHHHPQKKERKTELGQLGSGGIWLDDWWWVQANYRKSQNQKMSLIGKGNTLSVIFKLVAAKDGRQPNTGDFFNSDDQNQSLLHSSS